LTFRAL